MLMPFLETSENERFRKEAPSVRYWFVVLHELLGHGSGKSLIQTDVNSYNFDAHNPPIDPLTNEQIASWYKKGETWRSQFGDIAPSAEECRADLVAAYLLHEFSVQTLLGFADGTSASAIDGKHYPYAQ
jgi:dipeptidyl-peptidase III